MHEGYPKTSDQHWRQTDYKIWTEVDSSGATSDLVIIMGYLFNVRYPVTAVTGFAET